MKKLFAALLAFLMVFTVMPAAFSAAATETPTENGQQPTDNAGVTLFGFADWKLTNGVAEPSKPYNFIGFNSENPSAVQSKLNLGSKLSFAFMLLHTPTPMMQMLPLPMIFTPSTPMHQRGARQKSAATTWITALLT